MTKIIEFTNQDKILFPKSKITKGDLIEYYKKIAPLILPYLKNRPLVMQRFPDGIEKEGFYHKNAPEYFPSWIKTFNIATKDNKPVHYVLCNNKKTLLYLVNQATIVFHGWLSKINKLNYPDKMIFDLDPAGKATFKEAQEAAKIIKNLLDELNLKSRPILTGSRGVHIVIPLKTIHTFEFVHSFAQEVAQFLSDQFPKLLTPEISKEKRKNRIFVDYLRNSLSATAVVPYSVRALENGPISMPISWQELFEKNLTPQKYTINNVFNYINLHKKEEKVIGQSLKKAYEKFSRETNSA